MSGILNIIFFLLFLSLITILQHPINFIGWIITLPLKPNISGTLFDMTNQLIRNPDLQREYLKKYLKEEDIKYRFILETPLSGFGSKTCTVYKIY